MRPLSRPSSPFPRWRRSGGFSLVELAVVLAVLGLLAGTLVAPLAARIDASQRRAADAMLEDIENALIGFALLQRRLPCPDAGDGTEQTSCVFSSDSRLPWRTLGLPQTDPWGEPWRYRPDAAFANAGDTITLDTKPDSKIQIFDHDGLAITTGTPNWRVVAVVYSLGPNRRADGRNASIAASAPGFEGGEATADYDDRLRWIGHPFLIARLAQFGRL